MESKASRMQCQLSSTQGQVKRIFLDFLGSSTKSWLFGCIRGRGPVGKRLRALFLKR